MTAAVLSRSSRWRPPTNALLRIWSARRRTDVSLNTRFVTTYVHLLTSYNRALKAPGYVNFGIVSQEFVDSRDRWKLIGIWIKLQTYRCHVIGLCSSVRLLPASILYLYSRLLVEGRIFVSGLYLALEYQRHSVYPARYSNMCENYIRFDSMRVKWQ